MEAQTRKILIAEDDERERTALAAALGTLGACIVAKDGMEAVDFYMDSLQGDTPFSLAVLDLMMPRLDGLDVLRFIRERERQERHRDARRLPVIVASAVVDRQTIDEVFALGCDRYAAKPLDLRVLSRVAERLLR